MSRAGKHAPSVNVFRDNLVAIMEQKGISISELARRAEVERSGLSRFIHGEFGCALEYAFKLAKAVDVPLSQLVETDAIVKS